MVDIRNKIKIDLDLDSFVSLPGLLRDCHLHKGFESKNFYFSKKQGKAITGTNG